MREEKVKKPKKNQSSSSNSKDGNEGQRRSMGRRIIHDTLEIFVVASLLFAFIFAGAGYSLHKYGLSLDFMRGTISEALSDPQRQFEVKFGNIHLSWPSFTSSLMLRADNIQIQGASGRPFFSIERADIGLSFFHLLRGELAPEAIFLQAPKLRVIHLGQREFVFSFANEPMEIGQEGGQSSRNSMLQRVANLMAQPRSALPDRYKALSLFKLEEADITIIDFDTGRALDITGVNIMARRDKGETALEMIGAFPQEYGEDASLVVLANHRIDRQETDFRLSVQNTNLPAIARDWTGLEKLEHVEGFFSGSIDAGLSAGGIIKFVEFEISSPKVSVNRDTLFDVSDYGVFSEENIILKGRYEDAGKEAIIKNGQLVQKGETLARFDGIYAKQTDTPSVTADIHLQNFAIDRLENWWPDLGQHDIKRKWLVERLNEGVFDKLNASLTFEKTYSDDALEEDMLPAKWTHSMEKLKAQFTFSDLSVIYSSDLPAASALNGSGEINGKSMKILAEEGIVDGLSLNGQARVHFTDFVTKGKGEAKITMPLIGDMPAVLSYISHEKIGFKDYFDIEPASTKGQAVMKVAVSFPTIKDLKEDDLKIDVTAELSDISIPDLIEGLTLQDGPYALKTDGNSFSLKGKGRLNNAPIILDWQQFLNTASGNPYAMKIQTQVTATPGVLDAFVPGITAYVSGSPVFDVTYIESANGKGNLDVKGDLTQAVLDVRPMRYKKEKGVAADLTLKAQMKDDQLARITQLRAKGPEMDIDGVDMRFYQDLGENAMIFPQEGGIETLRMGETDLNLQVEPQADNPQSVNLILRGKSLDARPFFGRQQSEVKKTLPGIKLDAQLETIVLKNEIRAKQTRLFLDRDLEGSIWRIDFDGLIKEKPISLHFRPRETEGRKLLFIADNAGATLAALGLFDTMRGGTIRVEGEDVPGGAPQDVSGRMYIADFTIVDTPFLAQLFNALSLTGLFSLLEQSGISFESFKADYRLSKNDKDDLTILFSDGRTKGSSLGLTFQGMTNITQQTLDVSGTIVPVSDINKFFSKIPLIGELLAGGEGSALFAATYSIKGPDSDPRITFNPLSILTPGFLRTLFFEDDYDDIELEKDDDDKGIKPVPENRRSPLN